MPTQSLITQKAKTTLWLLSLGLLAGFVAVEIWIPAHPLDPWNLFNLKKIIEMVIAITMIQSLGTLLAFHFGARAGAIATGLLGGIISSTAMTASLAKLSKARPDHTPNTDMLIYYSASFAMLIEAFLLVALSGIAIDARVYFILLAPLIATLVQMVRTSRAQAATHLSAAPLTSPNLWSVAKLSIFVLAMIALARLAQRFLGRSGLFLVTLLMSLFEIHGSIIANTQLFGGGHIGTQVLGGLLATSIFASYLSKAFIAHTLGSLSLLKQVRHWTLWIVLWLFLSWGLFIGWT